MREVDMDNQNLHSNIAESPALHQFADAGRLRWILAIVVLSTLAEASFLVSSIPLWSAS